MCKQILRIAVALMVTGLAASAMAGPITSGNLVVTRIGGTTGSASAVFLEEFTILGAPQQTIPLPTTTVGLNRRFTNAGNATTLEGFLSLSTNGQYLTLAGHDAAVGTGALASQTHARVVARVGMNGLVDTSTALPNFGVGSPRSAVMDDDDIWVSNNSSPTAMMFQQFGATSSATIINNSQGGTRIANIYAGQLYVSADNGTGGSPQGVFTMGSGLPTLPGAATTLLPGFPTGMPGDPGDSWDYWFANPSTLYVADARTLANGGGLQKWTFGGSSWTLNYTLATNLTAGLRGLTGVLSGGGATLYATTNDAASRLVTVTDIGLSTAPFATLATAPAGSVFRGVELVPEPSTLLLLALGGAALSRRR